jgi:hypothetical protein
MVVVVLSCCACPFDHTPNAGGVMVLCGLGCMLLLGSVDGTVPRFGLG